MLFRSATKRHPKGFPVVVVRTDDQWLVDWPGFAEFHYALFDAFVSGPEQSGTFRLLIKPELAGAGDTGRQPFSASTPDLGKPTMIYAPDGSEIHQTLEDIVGGLAARAPSAFRKLMEDGGIPVILRLSKSTKDGETTIIIDEIVAQGWNPLSPNSP